jgi:hypothetical protein
VKNFRDYLAVGMAVIIFPLIWILQGINAISIPESVIGVTIALETLIAQFYFRKSGGEKH